MKYSSTSLRNPLMGFYVGDSGDGWDKGREPFYDGAWAWEKVEEEESSCEQAGS